MGYELLVCDLDGTLIDHSLTLEPALVTAFKRAAGAGLGITIATGRMPLSVDFYREALDIRYAHCPPILKAAKQLSASIERSAQLPAALLPLVYLRVALINGCPF